MKNMTAFGKNNLRGSARVPCLKIRFTSVSLYYGKHTQKCLDFRVTRFICEFHLLNILDIAKSTQFEPWEDIGVWRGVFGVFGGT